MEWQCLLLFLLSDSAQQMQQGTDRVCIYQLPSSVCVCPVARGMP